MRKRDKRGQELSVSTIVLVVLAVLVLVILIIGFTVGWKKILPFISSQNNVQQVAETCAMKCALNAQFDFCSQERDLSMEQTTADTLGLASNQMKSTCAELALKYTILGIAKCPAITCPVTCQSLGGDWKAACDNAVAATATVAAVVEEEDITTTGGITDTTGKTTAFTLCCKDKAAATP